jgi:hypothetical protein
MLYCKTALSEVIYIYIYIYDAVGHIDLTFSERLSNMLLQVMSLHVLFYNLFKICLLNIKVLLACLTHIRELYLHMLNVECSLFRKK